MSTIADCILLDVLWWLAIIAVSIGVESAIRYPLEQGALVPFPLMVAWCFCGIAINFRDWDVPTLKSVVVPWGWMAVSHLSFLDFDGFQRYMSPNIVGMCLFMRPALDFTKVYDNVPLPKVDTIYQRWELNEAFSTWRAAFEILTLAWSFSVYFLRYQEVGTAKPEWLRWLGM